MDVLRDRRRFATVRIIGADSAPRFNSERRIMRIERDYDEHGGVNAIRIVAETAEDTDALWRCFRCDSGAVPSRDQGLTSDYNATTGVLKIQARSH